MATLIRDKDARNLLLTPIGRAAVKDGKYLGVCVLNAPGGWTRCGPAWRMPESSPVGSGFVIMGVGVQSWGTNEGLAQLAVGVGNNIAKPNWHAAGLSLSDTAYLCLAVLPGSAAESADTKMLATVAEEAIAAAKAAS